MDLAVDGRLLSRPSSPDGGLVLGRSSTLLKGLIGILAATTALVFLP